MDEYDSPWKEAIEEWFEEFLAFYFPAIHALIDWSRGYEFLDKELQQLTPESAHGRRTVDKLVKVFRHSGEESWILVHVEVQSQSEPEFPRRMYQYRYRISDKYDRPVFSLAVLADDVAGWRPSEYREADEGGELIFRFPTVKLLDFADRVQSLDEDPNSFAVITLAHLKTQETRGNDAERQRWKIHLARGLYCRGYDANRIRKLYRVIDWLLRLPNEAEKIVWKEIVQIERETKMPYVTSAELIGIEKGMERGMEKGEQQGRVKGIMEGIAAVLDVRLGSAGMALLPEVEAIQDSERLGKILHGLKKVVTVEDARRLWADQ